MAPLLPQPRRHCWNVTRGGQRLRSLAVLLCASLGARAETPLPAHMNPLRGQYGFLSVFSGIDEDEARGRVRDMLSLNILEYEFYNACGGYSKPPDGDKKTWGGPFGVKIDKSLLRAYTDEITKNGGRSWLHVQMQATDPGDAELQSGATMLDPYKVNGKPLLDLVVPDAAWARKIAPRWATFAKSLGFQGIHWSTFGNWGDAVKKGADVHGFLGASLEELKKHGLGQTCNFVDGFGWDTRIQSENLVAFNYWVVWEVPKTEDAYFESHVAPFHGVYVAWPGTSAEHTGETWNSLVVGMSPFEVLRMRWLKAKNYNSSYLCVGDGLRRLQNDFYPNSVPLTADEVEIIRTKITCQPCGVTTSTTTTTMTAVLGPLDDAGQHSKPPSGPECDPKNVDTRKGVLQISPGEKSMVLSLTSHETALEELIQNAKGACWVEITDYVTDRSGGEEKVFTKFNFGVPRDGPGTADHAQNIPARRLQRPGPEEEAEEERVEQRRLQHLRAAAEEGSGGPPPRRAQEADEPMDVTQEVQDVLDPTAPYNPKVDHAEIVEVPDGTGGDGGGAASLPWAGILAATGAALVCCIAYLFVCGHRKEREHSHDHDLLQGEVKEAPLSNTPGSETRHQEAPLGDPDL